MSNPHPGGRRRPLPDELKQLMGNTRGLNKHAPKGRAFTDVAQLKIPNMIERDTVAMEEWARLMPELVELRLLNRGNFMLAVAIVLAWTGMVHAEDDVYEQGRWLPEPVFDKQGKVVGETRKLNPNIKLAELHRNHLKTYMIEFGITPSAATRVYVAPQEKPGEDLSDLFGDEKPN